MSGALGPVGVGIVVSFLVGLDAIESAPDAGEASSRNSCDSRPVDICDEVVIEGGSGESPKARITKSV
jgi:hypothetical protein